jgi:polyisoprenoid-binding protein YceI
MKKTLFATAFFVLSYSAGQAQEKLVTHTGQATIFSHTAAEDITATNNTVTGLINSTSGEIAISVPVQGFQFEKSLMQEHFNQPNFMDSKQFPKIALKGKIFNLPAINFTKDGSYDSEVSGELTIKGVTKPVTEKAHITIKNGQVTVQCKFVVKDISSFGVGKPSGKKKDNVANDIEVNYTAQYSIEA